MVGEVAAPAPAAASYTIPGQLPEIRRRDDGNGVGAAVVVVALMAALAMSSLLLLAIYYLHILLKSSLRRDKPFNPDVQSGLSQDFHRSMLPPTHISSSHSSSCCPAQVFTYKQLQFATCNFRPANLIDSMNIYTGVLPNGRLCAIKQLHSHVDHEFRVEVDLLSRLHSPYLVDLIGYCADLDHRLLVYEYMPNGSLQEQLRQPYRNPYTESLGNSRARNGTRPGNLDWGTRMQIALDAARGLEYLHEFVSPPIIHRDFKSSIILLGENFSAKISDFGLAKLGSDKMNGQVFTRVLGTQGYVAPEYALTGQLTTKSDVYSFGIVLLELITGRTPVDMERPPGQAVLVSWVPGFNLQPPPLVSSLLSRMFFAFRGPESFIYFEALPGLTDRDKVHEMVDPVLKGQYSNQELIQVAAIAAMCVQPEADDRPLMTDVVQSLVPLVLKQHS